VIDGVADLLFNGGAISTKARNPVRSQVVNDFGVEPSRANENGHEVDLASRFSNPALVRSTLFISEVVMVRRMLCTVINIYYDKYKGAIYGNDRRVRIGDFFKRTYTEIIVFVGYHLLGRILSPISIFLDAFFEVF
jgi:hypothetical protein